MGLMYGWIRRYLCCSLCCCCDVALPSRPVARQDQPAVQTQLRKQSALTSEAIEQRHLLRLKEVATLIQRRFRGFVARKRVTQFKTHTWAAAQREMRETYRALCMRVLVPLFVASVTDAAKASVARKRIAVITIERLYLLSPLRRWLDLRRRLPLRTLKRGRYFLFKDRFGNDVHRRVWSRQDFAPEETGWPVAEKALQMRSTRWSEELPPHRYSGGTWTSKATLHSTLVGDGTGLRAGLFSYDWLAVPVGLAERGPSALPLAVQTSSVLRALSVSPYANSGRKNVPLVSLSSLTTRVQPYSPQWLDAMQMSVSALRPCSALLSDVSAEALYAGTAFALSERTSVYSASTNTRGPRKPEGRRATKATSNGGVSHTWGKGVSPTWGKDSTRLHTAAPAQPHTWSYIKSQAFLGSSSLTFRMEATDKPYHKTLALGAAGSGVTFTDPLSVMPKERYRLRYAWVPAWVLERGVRETRVHAGVAEDAEEVWEAGLGAGTGTLTMREVLAGVRGGSSGAIVSGSIGSEPFHRPMSKGEVDVRRARSKPFVARSGLLRVPLSQVAGVNPFPHAFPWTGA